MPFNTRGECTCRMCREARNEPETFHEILTRAFPTVLRIDPPPRRHTAQHPRSEIYQWMERRLGYSLCGLCLRPEDSCNCFVCDNCGERRRTDDRCGTCERCSDCCDCINCPGCDNRWTSGDVPPFCDGCGRCESCCRCGSQLSSRAWGGALHGTANDRFPRHVGVEIECGLERRSGYKDLNRVLNVWDSAAHGDGSIELKNAIEVATAPARGSALEDLITETCKGLASAGARVDSSCGLHVHISAKDLTPSQILAVARLYSRIEVGLYSLCAPSRWDGNYSSAWETAFEAGGVFDKGSIKERMDRLEATIYGSKSDAEAVKRDPYKHAARYHGMNLNALLLYGTIEFRMHQGTVNPEKILNWAEILSAVVEYGANTPERQISRLSGTSFEVLCKVVKRPKLIKWMKMRREHFTAKRHFRKGLIAREPPRPVGYEDSESI